MCRYGDEDVGVVLMEYFVVGLFVFLMLKEYIYFDFVIFFVSFRVMDIFIFVKVGNDNYVFFIVVVIEKLFIVVSMMI